MAKVSDYIENGSVLRSKIAMDVANGLITKTEIKKICENKEIANAFIGKKYLKKKNQKEWDREYLDEVACAAVAECFNEDYLLYLSEVGDVVRKKNASSMNINIILGIVATVAVLAVIVGVVIWIRHNSGQ